jgi:glycosyltransferase involved in cell wall biosynthesis
MVGKSMKILIITNNFGGLYRFRKELVEALVTKYEVTCALPDDSRKIWFNEIGGNYIDTPLSSRGRNPIADFKLFMNYLKIVRQINPDIVLTYTIKPNIYGGIVCRILRVPYITNITGLGTAVDNKGILQKLTVFLYRIALKKACCIFFQNEENQEFFKNKNIIAGRYKLIPGSGVNLKHFYVMDYPNNKIIEFVFIGRIIKEKGIEIFLEAAEYIKSKYSNTRFHVIGPCELDYIGKLKEMQKKDIIIYHGIQDDIRKFHKVSHCTVHPTYYPEGMSNVLLESAACGRPIITTDRSGCREIVDDGINGYVVKPQNVPDLIEKIEKFINLSFEEKKQMGLAGRAKVEREFDRNIVVSAYLEEINNLV